MASKIIYVAMFMVILNLAFLAFSCTTFDTETGACLVDESNSTVWKMASNPTSVGGDFWDMLFGSGWGLFGAIGVGVGAVLIGTTIFGKNVESTIYIAIAIGLAGTVYPAIKLYQMITASSLLSPVSRWIFAIIIASTMVITVIFTILDWGRGRD